MAFQESFVNSRANHGDLPEATPFQGLERHIPASEQKQLHQPDHEEKEYHSPPAKLSPENCQVNHPASPGAYGSDPSWHPTLSDPNALQPQRERAWWKKKRFWIPLVALLLVGAIVGGIVGGLSNRNDSSSDQEASTGSPDSAAAALPSSPDSTGAPSSPKPLNSSLASVAWSEPSGLAYRRLYYQDDAGTIKESAWNSSGNEWYSSNENLAKAKPSSPIAAAVVGNTTLRFVSLPCRPWGSAFNRLPIEASDTQCAE